MYSPRAATASSFGRQQQFAGLYAQVGVHTGVSAATPHRLVSMLFEGFSEAVVQAKGAMRAGQVEAKGRHVTRAVRIIDEGLKAALNLNAGGPLAADLSDLYAYTTLRLTQANVRNDEKLLDECLQLIQPLHEAWLAIAAQVEQ
jgi:flagellar protein FliS